MQAKINELIEDLGARLKAGNFSLVTAESCTGGGLAYAISLNEICSPMLERGYVTYSNQAKQQLLEVLPATLQLYGAVSKETAIEMAAGALKHSGAQYAVATTGIAGPDMGEEEKTGELWIACVNFADKQHVKHQKISGNRRLFCENAILFSLEQLLTFIPKK